MCHSKNAKPPFYANFPIAGSLVKADMQMGLRSYDITDTVDAIKTGAKVSSTDLAKIEYAVDDGTMPPLRFKILHWKSNISAAERKAVANWIVAERAKLSAASGISKDFANEPVWPIPRSLGAGRLQSEARFDTLPPHGPFRRRNRILRDLPPARQGGRGCPPNLYGNTQAEGRHKRPHGLQCRIQRQAVLGRARRHPRTAGGRPADEPRRNGRRVLGKNRQTPRGRFRFQLGIQKGLPRRLHPKEHHRRHRRIRAHPHNTRQPV